MIESTGKLPSTSAGLTASASHFREVKASEPAGCVSAETKVGDRVYAPGHGIATAHSFFGFTARGETKDFIRVRLTNGALACFQFHV